MAKTAPVDEKRPVWLWAAGLYFIIVGGAAIVMTTLILTQAVSVDEEMTSSDYFLAIAFRLSSALYVAGGITLLLKRKTSYYLFVAAIAAIFASYINFWIVQGSSPINRDTLLFYAPEWIALIATTFYARKLMTDGYLT